MDIQVVTAWMLYNIWEVKFDTLGRWNLREADGSARGLRGMSDAAIRRRLVLLKLSEQALRAGFFAYSRAVGLNGYALPDMDLVASLAAEHYDNDLRGGEGHMEVGKLILNSVGKKSTLTLSVKPFGCMPSSGVSDGVQALVQERHPESLFCAVETSGDGEVNFQSRVQMYLHRAKNAAKTEVERALLAHGLEMNQVREYIAADRAMRRPLYLPPHSGTTIAVDMVSEVARRSGATKLKRWALRRPSAGSDPAHSSAE